MVKTYGELYRDLRYILQEEEGPNAARTARDIIGFVAGFESLSVLKMQSIYASEETCRRCLDLAGRMLAGEPLAYILGKWSFYGLELTVTPDVLIPRDDTMAVVELALEQKNDLPSNPRILDLCTGSGCIGLAIASQMKDARVTLVDVFSKALKIAKKNTTDLKLTARVSCIQADAMQPASKFLGQFDMIVSNPPYITRQEMLSLQRSVRDYEPHLALFGGEDGLDFYRAIVSNYTAALKPGGFLCFEFGMGQEDAVCWILEAFEYDVLALKKDAGGIIRAVVARKKREE